MIRGIKFAGIPVRDQDAALKFYTEKLGFKVVTDQPFTEKQTMDRDHDSRRGNGAGAFHAGRA